MFKRLNTVIPAGQLLLVVAFFALQPAKGYYGIKYILRVLVQKMNFPVWTVFNPLMVWADHWMHPLPAWHIKVLGFVLVDLILVAIALLWYVVVTEIEMRAQGKSILRFSGRWAELLKIAILFLLGGRAFFKAFSVSSEKVPDSPFTPHLMAVAHQGEVLSVLILVAWGIALVGVAISDLLAFLKNKASNTITADTL